MEEDAQTWCTEQLAKLLDEELRISTLTEMKDYLSALPQDRAAEVANALQLPLVFDCLNDSKTEQIDLACDILSLCMSNLSLEEITTKYGTSLERSLRHPSSNVKLMSLKEIRRTLDADDAIDEFSKQTSLLLAVIECIGDEELAVAKKASEIIVRVGTTPVGLKNVLDPEVLKPLANLSATSEIVRFRIYEIMVDVSVNSEEAFRSLIQSKLLSSLVDELKDDDVLLKLNVLEIITRLAVCPHGLEHLEGQEVLAQLEKDLLSAKDDALGMLSLPGLLKFFGNVFYWKPEEMYSRYPLVLTVLYDVLVSVNDASLGVALDTLGHIADKNEGKLILRKSNKQMEAAMKMLGKPGQLPTELRVRALNCIASLLKPEDPTEISDEILAITERWFSQLGEDPMTLVVQYASNPFEEIRLAAQSVLLSLAYQRWGQKMIKNHPGLVELLLNRSVEPTKQCKETKYDIIKALADSPVFDKTTLERFEQYVKEGPFYVQAVMEVVIEGTQ